MKHVLHLAVAAAFLALLGAGCTASGGLFTSTGSTSTPSTPDGTYVQMQAGLK